MVSGSFKEQGYSIIANDIQYYSYVITKHIDNEVNGVSSGATGINVNNKQEIA